jgi:hypothetical protein
VRTQELIGRVVPKSFQVSALVGGELFCIRDTDPPKKTHATKAPQGWGAWGAHVAGKKSHHTHGQAQTLAASATNDGNMEASVADSAANAVGDEVHAAADTLPDHVDQSLDGEAPSHAGSDYDLYDLYGPSDDEHVPDVPDQPDQPDVPAEIPMQVARQHGDTIQVDLAHCDGKLIWYSLRNIFHAICTCAAHNDLEGVEDNILGNKRRDQCATRGKATRKARCKGRPLGFMICWLEEQFFLETSKEHKDLVTVFTKEQRMAARAKLVMLPGGSDLMTKEAEVGPDSDVEPEFAS